jgi:hypothetical protein
MPTEVLQLLLLRQQLLIARIVAAAVALQMVRSAGRYGCDAPQKNESVCLF